MSNTKANNNNLINLSSADIEENFITNNKENNF